MPGVTSLARATMMASPIPGNGFGVGTYDQVDIVGAQTEGAECLGDLVRLVDAQEKPTLPAVFVGEALNGLTDCGRVDHRHQLGQVVLEHLVVQQLVPLVQLLKEQVTTQIRCQALQLVPHPVGLFVEREHRRWKPAGEPQPSPLLVREAHPVGL
jgi:hypothetical protein